MIELVADISSWLLIVLGAFFVVSGAVGLIRMPDFFTRLHPGSLAESLGTPMILTGLMIQSGFTLVTLKIALLILFLLLTSPTASHALAKAALLSGLKPLGRQREDKDV